MNFPYKGVLFDWAWTLVDLGPEDDRIAFKQMASFLESRGYVFEDVDAAYQSCWKLFQEQIQTSHKSGLEAHFETVIQYLALEREWLWDEAFLREALFVYYQELYQQRRVYPNVVSTLEALQQAGVRLGVVSNTTNPAFMKNHEMKMLGLDSFFHFAIYSSQVPFRKPHPSIFRLARKRMELAPPEILFVGDHFEADVIGARSVGMATAWLNHNGFPQPAGPIPDYEIAEISEVLSLRSSPVDNP